MKFLLLISIILTPWLGESAKILSVFQTPSKSHWILGHALLKELANSGHKVTVISPFPLATPMNNYRDIELTGLMEKFDDEKLAHLFETADESSLEKNKRLYANTNFITNFTLNHPNVQQVLKSNEKFDLIILELYLNDALLGLGQYYKCPIVGISPLGLTPWVNELIGSSTATSHNPHVINPSSGSMSFFKRMKNLFHHSYDRTAKYLLFDIGQKKIYQSVFPNPKPSFDQVRSNGLAVTLLNSHYSSSFSHAYLPNVIEVGGMQISPNRNPLPEEIQHFIDESIDGFVYFSMGSNLRQSKMCALKRQEIIKTFKNINLRVIWKFDDPSFNMDVHKVLLRNWFPQNEILAHPSAVAFIYHGGWLSQTEALYHGVPVIGIPIFEDQAANIDQAVADGWGLRLHFKNLTEMTLTKALIEITDNHTYAKRAKELSQRFRDRPQPAIETAKFWVEYVIRHEGAEHIKSSTVHKLGFIRYHNIDVFGLFLFIFLIFVVVPLCWLTRCTKTSEGGLLLYTQRKIK